MISASGHAEICALSSAMIYIMDAFTPIMSKLMNDEYSESDDNEDSSDVEEDDLENSKTKNISNFQSFEEIAKQISFSSNYLTENLSLPYIIEDWFKVKYTIPSIPHQEPLGTILYMVSNRNQITQQNEALNPEKLIIAWSNISHTTDSEFPGLIQKFFKSGYKLGKSKPTFYSLINPNPNSIAYLQQLRHDYPSGRVVFHYVGTGFQPITKEAIYTKTDFGEVSKLISFRDLFDQIKTPSFYIFDCENASIVTKMIQDRESKISNQNSSFASCFCLGAANINERLPFDSILPLDFFSTVLLTPLPIAILCHILKNYKTTFKESPLMLIQNLITETNSDLLKILEIISECVSADYLPQSMFSLLFRKELFVRTMFRRFVIAQYLMNDFSVSPISYPYLPPMHCHSMWDQWQTQADIWVTAVTKTSPLSFVKFFRSFAISLDSCLKYSAAVSKYLLVGALSQTESGEVFTAVANYVSRSRENRENFTSFVNFSDWLDALLSIPERVEQKTATKEQLHALLYIIISALHTSMNSIFSASSKIDFLPILNLTIDENYPEETRALASCVCSLLVGVHRELRNQVKNVFFVEKIEKSLLKNGPFLNLWHLILLKRAHLFLSASDDIADRKQLQFIIFSLLKSSSHEVRAAALSCMSLFCYHDLSSYISTLFCIHDCSFLVRMQLLLFSIRILSGNEEITFNKNLSLTKFSDIFDYFIHEKNSTSLLMTKATTISKESCLEFACFVIEFYTFDPNPLVSSTAKKAKISFENKEEKVAIPIGMRESEIDEFTVVEIEKSVNRIIFPSDSYNLLSSATEQIVSCGRWKLSKNVEEEIHKVKSQGFVPPTATNFVQVAHSQLHNKTPVNICYMGNDIAVACNDGSIEILCDDHVKKSEFRVTSPQLLITDTCTIKSSRLAVCTEDGCITVWSGSNSPTLKFRASPNYLSQVNLFCSSCKLCNSQLLSSCGEGVCLWDLTKQLNVAEFSFDSISSCCHFSKNSQQTFFVGGSNGLVSVYDTRSGCLSSTNFSSPVHKIQTIVGDDQNFFVSLEDSSVYSVDISTMKSTLITKSKTSLNDFALHPLAKVMIQCPRDADPYINNIKGNILCKIPILQNPSLADFNQKVPILTISNKKGELYSYQMI